MSNSIAPGSSADVNVRVTALTTNPNVPVTYKTIILKKNLVNGVNTLTQAMMSATNTKYVIKYDYVLGENITIPENCILEFDGGSLNGSHSLFGNKTTIKASNVRIFDTNISLTGYWTETKVNVVWFGAVNDIRVNSTDAFKAANRNAWNMCNVQANYQFYGEIKTVYIHIPTGSYAIEGDRIFGTLREEDEYPNYNVNAKFVVDGNNAILYWNVNNTEDRLFWFDYTIGYQYINNLKIFVYVPNGETMGTVFEVGNEPPAVRIDGKVDQDAGLSTYFRIDVASARNADGYAGRINKVFNCIGVGQTDQGLVLKCNFTGCKYVWYNTNSEAVVWDFYSCSAYSTQADCVYFYLEELSEYLNIRDCSFSVTKGQTMIKYNSATYPSGKLRQTEKDNIGFYNNRIEIYRKAEGDNDPFYMFVGNVGCLMMSDINFSSSKGSETEIRFLLSDAARITLTNCYIPICTITIPEATDKITGLGNWGRSGGIVKDCRIDTLYLKGYDWDNNQLVDITSLYLSTTKYFRYINFYNLRQTNNTSTYSFTIAPNRLGNVYQEERSILFYGPDSFSRPFKLPPFSIIRSIEVFHKPSQWEGNHIGAIRMYFGDKADNNYIDAQYDYNAREKYIIFEGFATTFYEDLSKHNISLVYIKDDGTTEINVGECNVVVKYISMCGTIGMRNISGETTLIMPEHNCAPHKGNTANRPKAKVNGGVLDSSHDIGFEYFDTTLKKPIYVKFIDDEYGTVTWIDATGTIV